MSLHRGAPYNYLGHPMARPQQRLFFVNYGRSLTSPFGIAVGKGSGPLTQ